MSRIMFQPRVTLLVRPSIDEKAIADVLNYEYGRQRKPNGAIWQMSTTSEGEQICEYAGRVCYRSFGTKQGRVSSDDYFANIFAHKHGSVLEHANYTFHFGDVSRYFTHELVRARAGFAYSQESTRYVDYDDCDSVKVVAVGMENEPYEEHERILLDVDKQVSQYKNAVARAEGKGRKAKRTAARVWLPSALATNIVVTANVRAWRFWIQLRGGEDAAEEMRLAASKTLDIMKSECPILFSDMRNEVAADGYPVVRFAHWKT